MKVHISISNNRKQPIDGFVYGTQPYVKCKNITVLLGENGVGKSILAHRIKRNAEKHGIICQETALVMTSTIGDPIPTKPVDPSTELLFVSAKPHEFMPDKFGCMPAWILEQSLTRQVIVLTRDIWQTCTLGVWGDTTVVLMQPGEKEPLICVVGETRPTQNIPSPVDYLRRKQDMELFTFIQNENATRF